MLNFAITLIQRRRLGKVLQQQSAALASIDFGLR